WTDDGKIVWRTSRYSTLPAQQLMVGEQRVPLAMGYDGAYSGNTLFYVRTGIAAPSTRMYMGGTAQKIWRWGGQAVRGSGDEAVCLTCDWKGTSKSPRVWNHRVYFLSDRTDNTMNVWSMDENGKDLKQVTNHKDFEVRDFAIDNGNIVYAQGADLHTLSASGGSHRVLPITIVSDYEQLRDKWVKNPIAYLS